MRHDDLLRVGEGAQALIGGHVAHGAAQGLTPEDAVALVALVPEILGVRHLRDVLRHHVMVAAEAAGREDHGATAEVLDHAARPFDPQADDAVVGAGIKVGHGRFGHHLGAGAAAGVLQQGEQFLAVAPGRDVQARARVPEARPFEVEQQRHAMPAGEPIEGRSGFAADQAGEPDIGAPLGLGHDIGDERLRIVLDAGGPLRRSADPADCAERHGCAAPGPGVALEDQHFPARIAGGQRRGEATGAGTDDGHLDAELELRDRSADDAHVLVPVRAGSPVRRWRSLAPCRCRAAGMPRLG